MAAKAKFYVTEVNECLACDGTGSLFGQPCEDCGATGTIEDAVELAAALTALGILLRLEQVERTAGRAAYQSDAMLNGGI